MDFWLQLAWPDSTEVNSFTEVDMQTSETATFCSKAAITDSLIQQVNGPERL